MRPPFRHPPFALRPTVRTTCLYGALWGGAAALLLAGNLAHAQAPTAGTTAAAERSYQIEPGTLNEALNRFARHAGITLSFTPQQIEGRRSRGLNGRYSIEAGLATLLSGTGLAARAQAPAQYTLQAAPPAAASAAPQRPASAPPPPRSTADAPAVELAEVQVTAEREQTLRNAGTVNTVTREELDRIPPTSTSDIFKGIPGVTTANARNGISVDVNIRGQQGDRVKVLVDGTQASSNTAKSYGGDGNHNYLDPDLISSITVEKGPNAGPYGAGTGGGVVNVQTLQAADLITGDKPWGLRLRGGWANNGGNSRHDGVASNGVSPLTIETPGRNLSGSVAGAWRLLDDKLELVAAHSQRRTGNYVAGQHGPTTYTIERPSGAAPIVTSLSAFQPGTEVTNTSQDTRSTLLKAQLRLPQDQSLELGYNQLDSRYGESRVVSSGNSYALQRPLSEVDKTTWTARYGWQPTGNPWVDLRMNLWQVDSDEIHADLAQVAADAGQVKNRGIEVWNTSVIDARWAELTLKYGGSWQREQTTGYTLNDPRGERNLGSLFAQAELRPSDGLSLDAGLRREKYTVNGIGTYPAAFIGMNPTNFDLEEGHGKTLGHLGFSITPWPSTRLYTRYSEGWRPPTAKETLLAYSQTRQTLQPESTRSVELGGELHLTSLWQSGDALRVKAAWFNNRHDDYIARASATNSSYGYHYYNLDGARFKGIELEANYDTKRIFASYRLNHYLSAQYCGFSGNACSSALDSFLSLSMWGIAFPPKTTQTLTLGSRWLDQKLTLGLRAHFVGNPAGTNSNLSQDAANIDVGWSAYKVYDLFGSYQATPSLNVSFSIENLGDRYYRDSSSNPSIAIPAPGRTAKVALTYQF